MKFHRITRERTCPVCQGVEAYRIRREGLTVKVVCGLLNLRPHYCPTCDTYYFGPRHSRRMHREQPPSHPATPPPGHQPHADSFSH
jgi:hypothetical protein